jgi:hypothetical protein
MKVVAVTPAGRRRYLEVLFAYMLKLRPAVDEYHLWVNTNNEEDIEYMRAFQSEHPDFVKLKYLPLNIRSNGNKTINYFFKECTDVDTVYVRFDDDIVYIDDITQFNKFIEFRKQNPKYFLVYGNIVNNAICTYLHQRNGKLADTSYLTGYECMDSVGWGSGEVARKIHKEVLNECNFEKFRMGNWILLNNERVSINVVSWLGREFKKFNGIVLDDEEGYISSVKPKELNKHNIIYGDFVCVHYSFFTQRAILDADETILATYRSLII